MKLIDFKNRQGLSIQELAELLEGPVASVKSWLYSDRLPRRTELIKIYDKTNGLVTPNDFVLPEDPDPPPEEEEEPPILDCIQKTAAE